MSEEHSKLRGLLVAGSTIGASLSILWYSGHRDRDLAERARQAAAVERAAAIKAPQVAESTPEAIEKRRFEAQLAALERADAEAKASAEKAAVESACRSDAVCWYKRHDLDANLRCGQAVERLAQYQFEWTNSWIGKGKFERAAWADKEGGTLFLMGDAIKMQNGYGAWRNMTYRCAYSISSGSAVASAE